MPPNSTERFDPIDNIWEAGPPGWHDETGYLWDEWNDAGQYLEWPEWDQAVLEDEDGEYWDEDQHWPEDEEYWKEGHGGGE